MATVLRFPVQSGKQTPTQYESQKNVTQTPHLGCRTDSSYDASGNLKQTIDGKGQVATYSYDLDDRLNQVDYYADLASSANTANVQKTVTFSYDKLNQLTGYDDGSTSAVYDYDDAGQLTSSSTNYGSFSLNHSYTWYPSNLKKTYTSPDSITYSYRYDSGGKLQSVSIPGQGTYTINQYKWNHPERVTLPGGGQIIVDYDGYMRGKRIQALDPASNQILDALYTFDPLDNIEVREALEAKYQYDYDNADRLITVDTTATDQTQTSTESYGYDPVGNRDNFNLDSWRYDDNDRLQQRGDWTYEYDGNGSQTKQSNAVTGEIKTYVYNLENRLSEIRDENNNLIASYSYDPFGKRISKTVGSTTTYYYYSEDGLVAETNNSGTITTSYHWQMNTPWGTDPMFIRQGGQYGFYITDHLGTPQRVVGSNGTVLWNATYGAFGGAVVSASSVTSNLRFPGQYFDAESGLHYNYFRYYDAGVGRYVSSDPIGLGGGINTYGYSKNNPIVFIDPFGLYSVNDGFPPVPIPNIPPSEYNPSNYINDYFGGLSDLIRGRNDMVDAGTTGSDLYFHCRANCEASKRGPGGHDAAKSASKAREDFQNNPKKAREADEAANRQGQCAGFNNPDADCYKACSNLIPSWGIPKRHLPSHAKPKHVFKPKP